MKNVMSVKELSNYLSCSESAIRKLVWNKGIPHFRILTKIMFDKESIDRWIQNQQLKNCKEEGI